MRKESCTFLCGFILDERCYMLKIASSQGHFTHCFLSNSNTLDIMSL